MPCDDPYGPGVVTSAAGVELVFNDAGDLPKGRHLVTVDDVEQLLVLGLPDGGTRRRLFDSWIALRGALSGLGVPVMTEWLDGSFVSNRIDPPPGDVDLVSVIDAVAFDQLPQANRVAASPLLAGHDTRDRFGVDSFALSHYSLGHHRHKMSKQKIDYWDDKWGRARKDEHGTRRRKGYLEVKR